MTYTQLALVGVASAVVLDLWIFKTRVVTRRLFWVSYLIIVGFQLISTGILTGTDAVRYDGAYIIGSSSPTDSAPPFIGQGRLVFAPVEDLFFGFALVVLTLSLWILWGRRPSLHGPGSGPARALMSRLFGGRSRTDGGL